MKYILCLGALCVQVVSSLPLKSDQQAYAYCKEDPLSFVAVVWPIAQGRDAEIMHIFNKYGAPQYQKNVFLSPDQAYHLLKRAHPFIPDMQEHVKWYFPSGTFQQKARVFVVHFPSAAQAVACKHEIRRQFRLEYRSVHINDTHSETLELARFFFKRNKQPVSLAPIIQIWLANGYLQRLEQTERVFVQE